MSKIIYRSSDFFVTDNGKAYSVYMTTGGAAEYYGSYGRLDTAIDAAMDAYMPVMAGLEQYHDYD